MNKVILVGRLVKDPEIRYTQTGIAVTSFTLAVNRRLGKNKQQQQQQQQTADFVPVVVWDKLAEVCGNYLVKGRQCLVDGRLQIRSYDDKNGNKRYVTEVIAQSVEFMDNKSSDNNTNNSGTIPEAAKSFGSEIPPDQEIPF